MPDKELLQQYTDEVLSGIDDRRHRQDCEKAVQKASETVIYGDPVKQYVKAALKVVNDGQVESAVEPDTVEVANGIDFLSKAAVRTEIEYGENRPDVLNAPKFRQEIQDLQVNVASGVIDLVSEQYGMTTQEGRNQVEFADTAFSSLGQRSQLLMAGLNYATFTGKTMLTGNTLLSNEQDLDLTGWTEKQMQEAMPHLVLSNMAIGQIVSALLQQGKADELVSIVDTGSGTGCTLAGSVLGIRDAMDAGANTNRLSITSLEGGRKFFDEELMPFSDVAVDRLSDLDLHKRVLKQPKIGYHVNQGQFNFIYGDILETLKQLKFSKEVQEGVVVITANYVWHRLPRVVKDAMIKEISKQAPNAIFLVADLVQNASVVNKRYFNFRDNGLLNCGNVGLDDVFRFNGYRLFELNEGTAPMTMDKRLASQIGQGTTSDAIFYVAYKGEKAADLVEKW